MLTTAVLLFHLILFSVALPPESFSNLLQTEKDDFDCFRFALKILRPLSRSFDSQWSDLMSHPFCTLSQLQLDRLAITLKRTSLTDALETITVPNRHRPRRRWWFWKNKGRTVSKRAEKIVEQKVVELVFVPGASETRVLNQGGRELLSAARMCQLDAVRALLDVVVDVDHVDISYEDVVSDHGILDIGYIKFQQTALHYAVACGDSEMVLLLLKAGADPNRVAGSNAETPLHRAILKGFPAIVHILIEFGANVALVTREEQTPLLLAISANQTDLARQFLNLAPQLLNSTDSFGYDAFMYATKYCQTDFAKTLLASGASLSRQAQDGWTAIAYASKCSDPLLVSELINRGVLESFDHLTATLPLAYAICTNQTFNVQLFLSHKFSVNRYVSLNLNDCHERKNGDDIVHMPLFHFAVRYSSTPIVILLIYNGADLITYGESALELVFFHGRFDNAVALIRAGVKVGSVARKYGEAAFIYAREMKAPAPILRALDKVLHKKRYPPW